MNANHPGSTVKLHKKDNLLKNVLIKIVQLELTQLKLP